MIRALLETGWHTLPELARLAGCLQTTAAAKARQLRNARYGGLTVLRRRRGQAARLYEYTIPETR